jgi:Kef-type K+ transport system membrane component KefB
VLGAHLGSAADAIAPVVGAQMTRHEFGSIVLVLLASTLGALLSRLHGSIVLPTVVLEIVLGMVIGPDVLGIADVGTQLAFLSNVGLAFLFFFAGLEVVEQRVKRRALRLGTFGWALSLVVGLVVGASLQLAGLDAQWWLLGVALSTTALGTLVPILSDAGLLPTPFGAAALGTGAAGEFWPIIFISIFLTSVYGALTEILLLVGFGLVVIGAAHIALRARPPRVLRVLQETVHTTGQTAVRGAVFLLAALVYIASDAGFEFVLGAFAAGLVVGLVLESPEGRVVHLKLEGIGFGFLIPIYFVVTGMTFDLDGFLTVKGMGLGAFFLLLFLVVRGVSALLWLGELGRRRTLGLVLCGATALPLIVAIVDIADDRDAVSSEIGAALIGAGMMSVLIYPLLATRLLRADAVPREALA